MVWRQETVLRTNLATNPNSESGTASATSYDTNIWTAGVDSTFYKSGSKSTSIQCKAARVDSIIASAYNVGGSIVSITPNTPLAVSFAVAHNLSESVSVTISVIWRDSSSTVLFTSQFNPADIGSTAKAWTRVAGYFTAPANAASADIVVQASRGLNAAVGNTLWIDDILIEKKVTTGQYFDGSFPTLPSNPSYRWNGTVNQATSDMFLPAAISPSTALWDSTDYGYSESWIVDGIDLQSLAFGITTVDSTPPELRGNHLSIPGRNGVIPMFNRSYDPGSVSLKMWILGCETDGVVPGTRSRRRQLFERNLRALMRILGYQGNVITLSRVLYGDYLNSGTSIVRAQAIIEGFTSIETMMARQRAEMTVGLTLVDSFWSDTSNTVDSSTASATLPQTINVSNVGTAPIDDSVITITGPVAAPKIVCPSSGSWIQYNDTLAAGQTLVIDSGAGTAKIGNTSVISKVSHGGTARFMVIPSRDTGNISNLGFTPPVTMSGTGGASTTKFSISYYRKHLVIV